jgi:hypothetical protein
MRIWGMRPGVTIALNAADRRRLEAILGKPQRPSEACLAGRDLAAFGRRPRHGRDHAPDRQVEETCVWRWQERFAEAGVAGLLRDKTRAPLAQEVIDRVVSLTATEPPHEASHWTGAAMAKAAGISVSSVQRIWKAHGLEPHRVRRFKLSTDPEFVPKLRDIVGVYFDPPAHAVVLSVDEKSQIQALDRTQPGLPLKKGGAGTMTHDYKRHAPPPCSPPSTSSTAPCSGAACSATGIRSSSASSTRLKRGAFRSVAISTRPTMTPSPSSGPQTPTRTSPPLTAGAKR